ncbi:binding-protein-dependent transport systems inner membrane component [Candidatus Moduliflexus flocculans]|uniref:Binding-protein-dependent transport systems inner membrane component n=1 Tax=Candidatus Moduliflexus flocculans TaxID=1499966 RepID=A0A081BP96_9BACT|nr:binding-protein-dependent transport systems inner membrane component [Candidatus Moduliflexus flocculans]
MATTTHDPRLRELQFTLSRIFRNPAAIIGFSLMAVFVAIAMAAPLLAPPYDKNNPYIMPHDGFDPTPKPPSGESFEFTTKRVLNIKRDKTRSIPDDVYGKLKQAFKDRQFASEKALLAALHETLGAEDTERYLPLIKTHTMNQGHRFGTTSGQYDIYYGIIWGTRMAFLIGIVVVGAALLIGVTLGLIAGYFGGWIDELIMRFVDVVYAIPMLVLAMAIVVAFGRGLTNIMIALALVEWRLYVRLFRAEILTIRERDFVLAAKTMGVPDWKIMLRHIFPNAIYPVLIVASMEVGSMVITAAFMSFIGLGAPPGYADWGQMVALARNYILGTPDNPFAYWFTVFFPGTAIVLFVLAWNLIGDALRDAFDPRQRRR